MKTPDRRQASSGVVGDQTCLVNLQPFSPVRPNPATPLGQVLRHTQFEKAFAMWLYQHGSASFDEIQRKFRRHPEWRAA